MKEGKRKKNQTNGLTTTSFQTMYDSTPKMEMYMQNGSLNKENLLYANAS